MTNEEKIQRIIGLLTDMAIQSKLKLGEYASDELIDCIEVAIKALEQKPKWIPCSERLPKAGEYIGDVAKYYLVQNEYGDMMVARYTHSEYWEQMYQLSPIADEIVAWRELPQPYKAGSEVQE